MKTVKDLLPSEIEAVVSFLKEKADEVKHLSFKSNVLDYDTYTQGYYRIKAINEIILELNRIHKNR
jgi:hypothetical protein